MSISQPEDERFARVTSALLQIVDNQLNSNAPPETRQTLERLVAQGYDESHAKKLIALVIRVEMVYVLKESKPFNEKRFIGHLNNLPELPEEPEV